MEYSENRKDFIGMKNVMVEIKILREVFGKWSWKYFLEDGIRKVRSRKKLRISGDYFRRNRNYREREEGEIREIIKEII